VVEIEVEVEVEAAEGLDELETVRSTATTERSGATRRRAERSMAPGRRWERSRGAD